MLGYNRIIGGALLAALACWSAHAQEYSYENMMGTAITTARSPSAIPILAYGENPRVQFPPRLSTNSRRTETTGTAAYCVRSCDGRYFPAPNTDNKSMAEGCKNLCPTTETLVYHGNSIDSASSEKGKPYSFRYRKELVTGCTCNGKGSTGLASIKLEDDKTLRRGDMVATAEGLQAVHIVDGKPRFAAASRP